jgi:hypothetical protein
VWLAYRASSTAAMMVGACGAASAFEACICFVVVSPAGCSWIVGGWSFCCPVDVGVGSVLSVAVVLSALRACRLHLSAG